MYVYPKVSYDFKIFCTALNYTKHIDIFKIYIKKSLTTYKSRASLNILLAIYIERNPLNLEHLQV